MGIFNYYLGEQLGTDFQADIAEKYKRDLQADIQEGLKLAFELLEKLEHLNPIAKDVLVKIMSQ